MSRLDNNRHSSIHRLLTHTRARVRLGLLLLALPLTAPTSVAQGNSGEPGGSDGPGSARGAVEAESQTKARARVLHLREGRTLRVRARLSGGQWLIGKGKELRAIPESSVVRVELESDLLKEMRRKETVLRKSPLEQKDRARSEFLYWLCQEGLLSEALEKLDRILEEDPDDNTARSLLQREFPPLGLTLYGNMDAERQLQLAFQAGRRARAATRERIVSELALSLPKSDAVTDNAKLDEAALELLLQRAHGKDPRERRLALLCVRRLFPYHAEQDLIGRSILDVDDDVRAEACRGLRPILEEATDPETGFETTQIMASHLRALESEVGAVRINATQALGWLGSSAAVAPLMKSLNAVNAQAGSVQKPPRANIFVGRQIAYIMDYDVEIASGSSIADPVVSALTEGSVLDARAYGANIQRTVILESQAIRNSLKQLTGAAPGRRNSSWLRWWKDHSDEYVDTGAGQAAGSNVPK